MEKLEVYIEDVGDESVGLQSEMTFTAQICDNMAEHLIENKTLGDFEAKLEALVREYFDAETYYKTYDTRDLEEERKYYERLEAENEVGSN